ncbi:MAG: purine-nucleoside phosphorylase [Treponema sp.]|jgi:purine-nucleoside phosphorylase|nr:purine-nucleoside phosphorylase [Treponema sp.]
MSIHIGAKADAIAEVILLPGDPLRAQFIAEHFLEYPTRYNTVRNMFGFTGTYKGKRISVQGTGMGIPSISIYINELFRDYGVQKALRIGTAGSIQPEVKIRDVILAQSASTDSNINNIRFNGRNFAPTASFGLLNTAYGIAQTKGVTVHVGGIVSSDSFYPEDPEEWKLWARFGCLAIEMECAELYTLAAKYKREALTLLTVSDSIVTAEATSAEERQKTFNFMVELALETACSA